MSRDWRNHLHRRIWIALATVLILGLTAKALFDYRIHMAEIKQQAQIALLTQKQEKLRQTYQTITLDGSTRADIEKAIGAHGFPPVDSDDPETLYYDLPLLGVQMKFRFTANGEPRGKHWNSGTVYRPQPKRLRVEDWIAALNNVLVPVIGNLFTPICFIPWFALCLWGVFRRDSRLWLGQMLIVWSLLNSLVFLMSPHYSLTLQGVMSNDRLFWGVVMSVAAVVTAHYGCVSMGAPWWQCTQCDYNLTGNVSGVCPESGAAIPREIRRRLTRIAW